MKPSWVLTDEERNRRFNKFNKINLKSSNSEDKKAVRQLRIPELYMTFTLEEQKLIDDIQKKFKVCHKAWLQNLLIFGRHFINQNEEDLGLGSLILRGFSIFDRSS